MNTSLLLLCHLDEEADILQRPPGLPMSDCAVPPVYAGVVEVPHEDVHSSDRGKSCQEVHGEIQKHFHNAVEIHMLTYF